MRLNTDITNIWLASTFATIVTHRQWTESKQKGQQISLRASWAHSGADLRFM